MTECADASEAIRDQLVSTMREELDSCTDMLVYCVEPSFDYIEVDWGPTTPDGLILKTDQGDFKVAVTVEKL